MGVDNEAKLVYGAVIDRDAIKKLQTYLAEKYQQECDLVQDLHNLQPGLFQKEFPHLVFDFSSACYDCREVDMVYFVSFVIGPKIKIDQLVDAWWDGSAEYKTCIKATGIPFEEPKIFALPHIW